MSEGTKDDPWVLKTPPGTSEYTMYRDEDADPPAIVCQVGKTRLGYQLRAIDDLHAMLVEAGDWVALGSADENKPAKEGTVEAWARDESNPVGGWYGLEGPPRALRDVHAAAARGPRPGGARARAAQQQDAGAVGRRLARCARGVRALTASIRGTSVSLVAGGVWRKTITG